ncbi:MAG: carbohydrate binding domain-containing protein, partial [Elusimicrobiota bacterium]|nr:carbohydrate binding domain-containing protein [Elusimicrobiota bacterium]
MSTEILKTRQARDRLKITKIRTAPVFLVVFLFATASFGNLLTNPGFETGDTSGWSPTPSTLPSAAYGVDTFTVQSGTYSLKISTAYAGSARNTGLYQNIEIEPYATYILSGYIWNNDSNDQWTGFGLKPGGGGFYGVTVGVHNSTYTTMNSSNWQYLWMSTTVGNITTMGVSACIRIGGTAAYTTSYFDNISFVKESTPPASVTNLSAFTGSLGGEVDLTWTAPGNNDTTGVLLQGSEYAIKYTSDI